MNDGERETRLPDRESAKTLLEEYTRKPGLIKHALAVEAVMRAYARKHGEDEHAWGLVGLLHDFDYERWPNDERLPDKEHPTTGVDILRQKGYPDEILQAILGHAEHTGVPRETLMAKTLFAVDELTGFLTACALVRPEGINGMKVKSVKKKFKDSSFARGVNRDDVRVGLAELDVEFGEHVQLVIDAMTEIQDELGLGGSGSG